MKTFFSSSAEQKWYPGIGVGVGSVAATTPAVASASLNMAKTEQQQRNLYTLSRCGTHMHTLNTARITI